MNKKEFLLISITVFLTIIVWIGADIYHEFITDRAPKDVTPAPVIKDYQLSTIEEAISILKNKIE